MIIIHVHDSLCSTLGVTSMVPKTNKLASSNGYLNSIPQLSLSSIYSILTPNNSITSLKRYHKFLTGAFNVLFASQESLLVTLEDIGFMVISK